MMMHIEEGVLPKRITPSCIILDVISKLNPTIVSLFIQINSFFKNMFTSMLLPPSFAPFLAYYAGLIDRGVVFPA